MGTATYIDNRTVPHYRSSVVHTIARDSVREILLSGPSKGSALVTGAASGIGRAAALRLVKDGFFVVGADIDAAGLETTRRMAHEWGGHFSAEVGDITSRSMISAAVAAATATGPLRAAVNNAGMGGVSANVVDYPEDVWRQVIELNLNAVFLAMQEEISAMLGAGGGSIVNVTSVHGEQSRANLSAYVASKHAVVGLTKTAALEYGANGIRVNAVGPGYIETPFLTPTPSESERQMLAGLHALERLGDADEVAGVISFLCGPDASFVTGSHYMVDGGFTA